MAPAAIVLGVAIGVAVGMLGGGGSVLAVPILVYVLGQDVHEATTSSLVIVTAGSLAGGLSHALEGRVCHRHAALFVCAALPGIVVGTLLGNAVSGDALLAGFALVMLAAAVATRRKADADDDAAAVDDDGEPVCPRLRPARSLAAGLLIGTLTGFFGVGGGFVVVPTLAIYLSFSMRLAVGTSLAIVTATSTIGLVAHLLSGRRVDVSVTALMTVACVVGALAGAALAERSSERGLGRRFSTLLAVLSVYLLISALLLGGPPAP